MARRGTDNHPANGPVIQEWDAWSVIHPDEATAMNGMMFFNYLQKHRPDLLKFADNGDKWQTVHGWLLRERRVAN